MQCMRIARAALGCAAATLFAAVLPLTASAHEHREVAGGQYEMTVGFIDEPAFVGEQNGLTVEFVSLAAPVATPLAIGSAAGEGAGVPADPLAGGVEGLVGSIQAEVIVGDQRMALTLTPSFGEPGVYHGIFFPTQPGDYTFRIFGDLQGTPLDETFTSSPEGFDAVQDPAPLQFPKPAAADADTVATTAGVIDGDLGGLTGGLLGTLAAGVAAAAWAARWLVGHRRTATADVRT